MGVNSAFTQPGDNVSELTSSSHACASWVRKLRLKKNSCPVGEQGVTFRKLKRGPKWMRKIRFPEEHLEIRLLFLPWGVLRGFLLLNLLTAISSSNIECQLPFCFITEHQPMYMFLNT